MSDHVTYDELADAAEHLLTPERGAEVERHLAGCTDCVDQLTALQEVTALLASAPSPAMPPEVAARLDAVLAQEQASRSTGPGRPGGGAGARPGTHGWRRPTVGSFGADLPRPSRGRRLGLVLAAAAVAALVGFGGYVLSASAGLNEPPIVATAVNPERLGADAGTLERLRDLDPHRFSRAWQCARKVTEGRITGLAEVAVQGRPALLVYTRDDGVTRVTVVTGCAATPKAGASAVVPG